MDGKEAPAGFEPAVEVLQTATGAEKSVCRQCLTSNSGGFAVPLPYGDCPMPPELVAVVERWDRLPDPVRAGILAMVRAAVPE